MDITGISVAGFSAILVLLWLIVILWAGSIFRKIYLSTQNKTESPSPWFVWQNNRWRILVWFLFLLMVIFYSNQESAYRPKTIIHNPAQHQLDTEMYQLDEMEPPIIKKSLPLTPMGNDNTTDALKKNDLDNKKSREEFNKL